MLSMFRKKKLKKNHQCLSAIEMGVDSYVLEMVQLQVFLLIRSAAMLLLVPELC
jgi:hypothetical protein